MKQQLTVALLVVLIPLSAEAGVIGSTANVNLIGSPADVSVSEVEANGQVTIFQENYNVSLANLPVAPAPPDQALGGLGSPLSTNSYYLSFDPVGDPSPAVTTGSGTITFGPNERIVAVYGLNDTINDNFFPEFQTLSTIYPAGNRGLEDVSELPNPASLGTSVLDFNSLQVGGSNIDQYRVVTENIVTPEIVARYQFSGSDGASNHPSIAAMASDLENGDGLPDLVGSISGAEGNPAPAIDLVYADFDYATLADSLAADAYYSFTVTPEALTELTFTNLEIQLEKDLGPGAIITAALYSDIDGFTLGNEVGVTELEGNQVGDAFFARFIDLSSLPADITSPVEFRLYLSDGGATGDDNPLRLDNITLSALVTEVVVPEPSTLMLLPLVAMGLLRQRRRRHRQLT